MRIENAGELIHWTYFMMDWKKAAQSPSDRSCQVCRGQMNIVEAMTDAKGTQYDGYVCHKDKVLVWVRSQTSARP